MAADTAPGLTVRDIALRYRVGPDKVRSWIIRGELAAVNTASRGKPRWVITPESLTAFEGRRAGGPAPKAARRPRRRAATIDYFPEL